MNSAIVAYFLLGSLPDLASQLEHSNIPNVVFASLLDDLRRLNAGPPCLAMLSHHILVRGGGRRLHRLVRLGGAASPDLSRLLCLCVARLRLDVRKYHVSARLDWLLVKNVVVSVAK